MPTTFLSVPVMDLSLLVSSKTNSSDYRSRTTTTFPFSIWEGPNITDPNADAAG